MVLRLPLLTGFPPSAASILSLGSALNRFDCCRLRCVHVENALFSSFGRPAVVEVATPVKMRGMGIGIGIGIGVAGLQQPLRSLCVLSGAWRRPSQLFCCPQLLTVRSSFSNSAFEQPKPAPSLSTVSHLEPSAQSTDSDKAEELVYEAPFWRPIRQVKLLSFTSMCLSLLSVPMFLVLPTPMLPTLSSRLILSAFTVSIGVVTTVILTRVSRRYVTRIYRINDLVADIDESQSTIQGAALEEIRAMPFLALETLDIRGRFRRSVHHLSAFRSYPPKGHSQLSMATTFLHSPPPHPFGLSSFYVHVNICEKSELLKPLVQLDGFDVEGNESPSNNATNPNSDLMANHEKK